VPDLPPAIAADEIPPQFPLTLADVVIGLGTAARSGCQAVLCPPSNYVPREPFETHSHKPFVFLDFFDGLDFLILGDQLAKSPF
jgi:hypothetical protein